MKVSGVEMLHRSLLNLLPIGLPSLDQGVACSIIWCIAQ
jgi:hypothetical protein